VRGKAQAIQVSLQSNPGEKKLVIFTLFSRLVRKALLEALLEAGKVNQLDAG
jgi:hypothetical protein